MVEKGRNSLPFLSVTLIKLLFARLSKTWVLHRHTYIRHVLETDMRIREKRTSERKINGLNKLTNKNVRTAQLKNLKLTHETNVKAIKSYRPTSTKPTANCAPLKNVRRMLH